MKVKINKLLIHESWAEFVQDVNQAASHGTPGIHTATDTLNKIHLDHQAIKDHANEIRAERLKAGYNDTDWDADRIRKKMSILNPRNQLNESIVERVTPEAAAQAEHQAKVAEAARITALENLNKAKNDYELADQNYDTAQDNIPTDLGYDDIALAGGLGMLGTVGAGGLGYAYAKRNAIKNRVGKYAANTRPFRFAANVVNTYK